MEGIELRGCLARIRSCAVDLLSLEEEMEEKEEIFWDLIERELRLKATFLYFDLNRVVSKSTEEEQNKMLTLLANKFFSFMDQLDKAVKSRSISMTQLCYNNTVEVLQQVIATITLVSSSHQREIEFSSEEINNKFVNTF